MHTTPFKQQHQTGAIAQTLRQMIGWVILYAGVIIMATQIFRHLS